MTDLAEIRFLKLPFIFNVNRMKEEVAMLLQGNWVPHFNKGGYTGDWNSISLMAPKGDEANIFALPDQQIVEMKETPALQNAVYLKEVLNYFKAPFLSARLLRLAPNAFIKPHKDYNLGYANGCIRLHVPVITNASIEFILDGNLLKMQPGECWYTNVNYTHSVANNSNSDRIHLVLDLYCNEWTDKLFFSLAPKEQFFMEKTESYSQETQLRMLEELKHIDTPAAKELITKIKEGI